MDITDPIALNLNPNYDLNPKTRRSEYWSKCSDFQKMSSLIVSEKQKYNSHIFNCMLLYFIWCTCAVYFRDPEVWMAPEVVLDPQGSLWVSNLHFTLPTRTNVHTKLTLQQLKKQT